MPVSHTLFRGALLCSTLAAIAMTPAAAATLSRADLERVRAATGAPASPVRAGNGAAAHFSIAPKGSTYTILHSFAGGTGDGSDSTAEVTLDASGNIDGTTGSGGANGNGTIFKLTSGGTETLLHSFGGSGDGTTPDGAVSIDSAGDIYGTTQDGGAGGNGTIYELTAGGTYNVLHSFAADEGSFIRGHLTQDKQGNFYGTALFGGTPGYGTVFKYSTGGTLTVVHAFDSTDGEYPEHGVASDKAGNLYGATAFGGTGGQGTVYEISKKGKFSTLYNFTGGATDGGFIYGGVTVDKAGNVYGNTAEGGANGAGTVFKVAPDGTLTTLYNFTGSADGGSPEGDVLLVGKNIYGTTSEGGAGGQGGVYEITSKGKEKTLAVFSAANGDGYAAGLTPNGKNFLGTTAGGGADGDGVVFSLTK
jgi:uncharacterized repeat protein (TIGR03803 family)